MDSIEISRKLEMLENILNMGPNDFCEEIFEDFEFYDKNKNKIIGIKTIADPDTDKEQIFVYKDGIYIRGESILKEKIENTFNNSLKYCESIIEDLENVYLDVNARNLLIKLKNKYIKRKHTGVLTNIINETLNTVRRRTFINRDSMNPSTHIPFRNGYLNIETYELEPLNPSLFFTWQVNANYLNREIDPEKDMPLFVKFISTLVPPEHLFAFLFYFAYATLYPGFPVHKVLWIVGRQRIGKGASVRLLHLLNPEGHGSISIAKLLSGDFKFDTSSIVSKNFVSDMEVGNTNTIKDGAWGTFNGIFGGDFVDIEAKYKQKYSGQLHIKGIFIKNLPMLKINSDATIERIIIIPTLSNGINARKRIPEIERKIFDKEAHAIATYFAHLLKILKAMNWIFPEKVKVNENGEIIEWDELDLDTKSEILEDLSDEVKFFIEEMTEHPYNENFNNELRDSSDDNSIPVDEVYSKFKEWCQEKGIAPLSKKTFIEKFGREYPKKRKRINGDLIYAFTDLKFQNKDSLEHYKNDGKISQYNDSEYIKCLFQMMDIKLISLNDKMGAYKELGTDLEQEKKPYKVITRLNFQCKNICSKLFEASQSLEQGIIDERYENNPDQSSQNECEKETDISKSKSSVFNDYHYFRSLEYFPNTFFYDLGIQHIEHKQSVDLHYYKIPYSEISENKFFKFSSEFASRENVYVIDENEYNSVKEEKEVSKNDN